MSHNPFAKLISDAEAREAETKLREEQAARAAAEARNARAAQNEVARLKQGCIEFGRKYLEAVALRVVPKDSKPEFIRLVQQHAEALLLKGNDNAPKLDTISEQYARAILQKFEYGLTLAAQRGIVIPDNYFYGQRLLAEQESQKSAKPERIVIRPGSRPRAPKPAGSEVVYTSQTPADQPVTRRTNRTPKKYRKDDVKV